MTNKILKWYILQFTFKINIIIIIINIMFKSEIVYSEI